MKSFDSWTYEEVQKTFGIKKVQISEVLNNWLITDKTPSDFDNFYIESLRITLKEYVDSWNEDEIKFHFIGWICLLYIMNALFCK